MPTLLAVFDDKFTARDAVLAILAHGIERDEVSLVASARVHAEFIGRAPDNARRREAMLATSGGAMELLATPGSFTLPGIGVVVAEGALTAALAAAERGERDAVSAFVEAGVPHEDAQLAAEALRRGALLVLVDVAREALAAQLWHVLREHGAVDPLTRERDWRGRGWREFTRDEQPLPDPERALYEDQFRDHYQAIYSGMGSPYEDYVAAYEFGVSAARSERFRDVEWRAAEDDIRDDWERARPGDWEDYRDAIRFGWGRVRARRFEGHDRRSRPRTLHQPYYW